MAAITALAHIGFPHANDGGLRPEYLIQLSEGDRPAWVLDVAGVLRKDDGAIKFERSIIWIPTLERMADDLLVMVGAHILHDAELLELFETCLIDPSTNQLGLYSIPAELREAMYTRCREYEGSWKLALTVFEGSSLQRTLSSLASYKCQLEVCRSTYVRMYDRWDEGKTKVHGSLLEV